MAFLRASVRGANPSGRDMERLALAKHCFTVPEMLNQGIIELLVDDSRGTEYACLTLIYVEWITLQFFPARKARDYLAAIFNGSSLRHTPPSAADAT